MVIFGATATVSSLHSSNLKVGFALGLFLLGVCVMVSQPAQAGFRYVPPAQQAMMQPAMQSVAQTNAQANPQTNGVVQGFASQVPLTVALRQVLPRGMAFRIADNVTPTTQVSWHGGQPWQQTLDQMLAGAGLQASYSQNTVVVQRGAMVMGAAPELAPVTVPFMAPQPLPATSQASMMPAMTPASMQPVTLTPPLQPVAQPAQQQEYASEAAAYVAAAEPAYTPPVIQPAPQPVYQPAAQPQPEPYITAAATGTAATVADGNATVGAEQRPVQSPEQNTQFPVTSQPDDLPMQTAQGTLPGGTTGEAPQQNVPGTEIGGLPPMQSGALNPLMPGPSEAQPSQLNTPQAQLWEAHSGQSLHEVITAWAQRGNVELNWVSEYDYPIEASLAYTGNFEDAVRTLLGGFVNASPQPVGRLHRNEQLGQQALIIETRGNQYDE